MNRWGRERAGGGAVAEDKRQRLDTLLVERGLARSRGEAQCLILAGRVRVNGAAADKPGRRYPLEVPVTVAYPETRYVSRGGVKLAKALDTFGLDVCGLVGLDVGASTGGFTDCLLARGARRVYAIDVGYGLLAWSLRSNPRVVTVDRTNARYLTRDGFRRAVEHELERRPRLNDLGAGAPGADPDSAGFLWPTFAACDLSFISLLKVVPAVVRLLKPPRQMILLVKPQFEAGRDKIGSKGVVRDPAVHVEVLTRLGRELPKAGATAEEVDAGGQPGEAAAGLEIAGLTYSPIRGPEGNIEYLLWLSEAGASLPIPWSSAAVRAVVEEAFDQA